LSFACSEESLIIAGDILDGSLSIAHLVRDWLLRFIKVQKLLEIIMGGGRGGRGGGMGGGRGGRGGGG